MLCELGIKNFAIIDNLRITFKEGLSVLSGETGAGKSIIINAVNLLLGSRASSKLIRTGQETAELEALFRVPEKSSTADIMRNTGFDPAEGLIIRRIISSSNKHKIYINGSLSTIQTLTQVTGNLASISGQHAHQGLLREEVHLSIVDQSGTLQTKREKVKSLYLQILPLIKKVKGQRRMEQGKNDKTELLRFQLAEIEEADLRINEDQELEQEIKKIKNSESLLKTVHSAINTLYSSGGSVSEVLSETRKEVEKAGVLDEALLMTSEKISDLFYRVEDITGWLQDYAAGISMDEALLEELENRLNTIRTLKRKYGNTIEEVLIFKDNIKQELTEIGSLAEEIQKTETKLRNLHQKLTKESQELSDKRKTTAVQLSKNIEKELTSLNMPDTQFEIKLADIQKSEGTPDYLTSGNIQINENGQNTAEFLFSANIGETTRPLVKIASGGELSRVVLALKAILARHDSLETVVFDEVDAGIGGSTAEVVGKKISDLSKFHQVICITHLPQISKFGSEHFKIQKSVKNGRTSTIITKMNRDERIREMARMLGGIEITEATLDHAREMLEL